MREEVQFLVNEYNKAIEANNKLKVSILYTRLLNMGFQVVTIDDKNKEDRNVKM